MSRYTYFVCTSKVYPDGIDKQTGVRSVVFIHEDFDIASKYYESITLRDKWEWKELGIWDSVRQSSKVVRSDNLEYVRSEENTYES